MSNLFSLFCLDKFPVRTLAANRWKCPRVGHFVTKTAAARDRISNFYVFFPVNSEFGAETGLRCTASSATECRL
jgi:hypothetical protein